MPAQLALNLLGPPQIYLNHESVSADRRKVVALLAYLAVEGGRQTRDALSALLWPDYDQSKAFTNLRHTLWEVQQAIGEGWIVADRETVGLYTDAEISLDVRDFESLLISGRGQENIPLRISVLSDAVKLYRNHFLSGFSLKDALGFNEWAFAKSEDLRHQLASALTVLSDDHCAVGNADQGIPYARRLITLDPLNETSHRQLMQVYLQAGQHSAALKQYQACEQLLRKELGIDPQPETRALYKKIRKREVKAIPVEKKVESVKPRNNLPAEFSTFIGRGQQLDQIANLMAKHRLVTLVGAGGIGKTRLALQVGQKRLNDYPNGVWFITLDSLSDSALIPQAVAAVFDIRETSEQPLTEKLIDFLHPKTSLLILDNCEHLLDACAQLVTIILKNCPNIKILATSRETLNMLGEAVYYIPSLSMPERDLPIPQLLDYESIRLFNERAGLALSSFTLTNENAAAVVEICRKVDGIPLAIELAAARVNLLRVEEILKQLQDSFALLTSDRRSILPRQQTLQASMDWSWGLLNESEQGFLQQLSVFAGGWTLESAQAVCDGDVLEFTNTLVKKSLIVVNQEAGHETRCRFHEIVRQYAHEKFVESDQEQKIRSRHLKYFLSLSERADVELRGPAQVNWMDRLNDELNNLRAALHWAEKNDVEAGLLLSGRLLRFWESADLHEGTQWLETFLHKSQSEEFPLARATALLTYGWLLTWLQQFIPARTVTEESLSLFRTSGDKQGEIDALISLANIDQFLDELDSGTERLQQALDLAQALGDRWRQAVVLGFLGWDPRDMQQRFTHWEKAIQLYREVGDQISLANLLSLSAQFRVLNGDFELGEKYLDESTVLWHSNRRANVWEHPKSVKSLILLIRGEYEQAYEILQEALVSAQETGNRMSYLWLRVRLGYIALRAGNLVEAHDLFAETVQDFYKDGYIIGAVFALEGITTLLIATGKPEKAARLIGCADAIREKIPDRRPLIEEADMYRNMAAILSKIGPSGFEVAYDEGRSMTLEETIAYALEENQSLSSALGPERETNRAKG
jgi:predicted ATPase/DNA-binding SARP family transcriptional activator